MIRGLENLSYEVRVVGDPLSCEKAGLVSS